jgi:hypothetical protein
LAVRWSSLRYNALHVAFYEGVLDRKEVRQELEKKRKYVEDVEVHVTTRELFEKWYRNFIDVFIPPRCRNAATQDKETALQLNNCG